MIDVGSFDDFQNFDGVFLLGSQLNLKSFESNYQPNYYRLCYCCNNWGPNCPLSRIFYLKNTEDIKYKDYLFPSILGRLIVNLICQFISLIFLAHQQKAMLTMTWQYTTIVTMTVQDFLILEIISVCLKVWACYFSWSLWLLSNMIRDFNNNQLVIMIF